MVGLVAESGEPRFFNRTNTKGTEMEVSQRVSDVVRKVIALRELKTMQTTRSQNLALQTLDDDELAVAALLLKQKAGKP